MFNSTFPDQNPYQVTLLDCPSLSADQRSAAELRFRMALEASLGGADYVLPTLQSYMLAQLLNEDLASDNFESQSEVGEDKDKDHADDDEAEEQVIELWETAEAEAILIAMKPLSSDLVNAQFQITPL